MRECIFIILLLSTLAINLYAQETDVITLTVDGAGDTKEISIHNALRNAIEQTYGTFISSNTVVKNDELLLDEIVTVSQGNIIDYKILSSINIKSQWYTTLQATISINKLATICESKGMKVDFKGDLFFQNFKIYEFNKKSEEKIMNNLMTQITEIITYCYDYTLTAKTPVTYKSINNKAKDDLYAIELEVAAKMNNNMLLIEELLISTLKSLVIKDIKFLSNSNIDYYSIDYTEYFTNKKGKKKNKTHTFRLNYYNESTIVSIVYIFESLIPRSSLNFSIVNDLGIIDANTILNKRKENSNYLVFNNYDTNYPYRENRSLYSSSTYQGTVELGGIGYYNRREGRRSNSLDDFYKNSDNRCYFTLSYDDMRTGGIINEKRPLLLYNAFSHFWDAYFNFTIYNILSIDDINSIKNYNVISNK